MKKLLIYVLGGILLIAVIYYAVLYFVPYSQGTRAGELIKFSYRGVVVKTYEGEISQGISGAQIFSFSVLDKKEEVIKKLKKYQGEYVELTYIERFGSLSIWGDTKYFVTGVELSHSPHFRR